MPYGEFVESCLIDMTPDDDCLHDALDDHLPDKGPIYYGGPLREYELGTSSKVLADGVRLTSLIHIIGSGDDRDHVLFIPNSDLAKKWYRFDDDIDWYLAMNYEEETLQSQIDYLPRGNLNPFWDEYMDGNGVRVMSKVKLDGLQHGVPDILRWWLTEYNILALPGVGKLRPMRAQWWG
jgi:hypothetical protein